ncbi:MAG: hypothetical protein RI885_456 [Actinomycetota bacterium]
MGTGHHHGDTGRPRLAVAFGIIAALVVTQAVGTIITGSLALLVDTAHMITDAGGLLLALVAATVMHRPVSDRYTWGLRRTEVLSAMLQAGLLLGVGVFALVEGIRRLVEPPPVAAESLLVFGVIGLAANIAAMVVLASHRRANLNMQAAFIEVLADALGSVAVIVSAVLMQTLGWNRADAVAALVIAAMIIPRTAALLRESFGILLENTPKGVDLDDIRAHIIEVPHVVGVHDLHVTRISSDLPVLTAHVVVEDGCFTDGHTAQMLAQLQSCVAEHFELSIEHSTFQIEPESNRVRENVHHD